MTSYLDYYWSLTNLPTLLPPTFMEHALFSQQQVELYSTLNANHILPLFKTLPSNSESKPSLWPPRYILADALTDFISCPLLNVPPTMAPLLFLGVPWAAPSQSLCSDYSFCLEFSTPKQPHDLHPHLFAEMTPPLWSPPYPAHQKLQYPPLLWHFKSSSSSTLDYILEYCHHLRY